MKPNHPNSGPQAGPRIPQNNPNAQPRINRDPHAAQRMRPPAPQRPPMRGGPDHPYIPARPQRPQQANTPYPGEPYGHASGREARPYPAPQSFNHRGRKAPRPIPANVQAETAKKTMDKKEVASPDQKKNSRRWLITLLNVLIAVICLVAVFLYLWPIYQEQLAVNFKNKLLKNLEENPKQIVQFEVPKNYGAIVGEAHETVPGVNFIDNEEDDTEGDSVVQVTYVGRLVYPKLGMNAPLSKDISLVSLRFGVGIFPESADLLEDGMTSIWGHRFLTRGRDFNRLGEAEVGDKFYIDYNVDGMRHNYEVYQIDIIPEGEIYARAYEKFEENIVMLVTCHPLNFDAQNERLLVYAKPLPELDKEIPE